MTPKEKNSSGVTVLTARPCSRPTPRCMGGNPVCPDMRESLRLDLVDADEAEEGRDRLLAAARTRAIRPVAGATFSVSLSSSADESAANMAVSAGTSSAGAAGVGDCG